MIRMALFILGGAVVGFAFHRLVGCPTGGCPIWANPYASILVGALMGFVASGGLG